MLGREFYFTLKEGTFEHKLGKTDKNTLWFQTPSRYETLERKNNKTNVFYNRVPSDDLRDDASIIRRWKKIFKEYGVVCEKVEMRS